MQYKMKLTPEEEGILNGSQGEVMAKVMKTLVLYGDAFGAERFVPVVGQGHLVTSFGLSVLWPVFNIMDELINAGLKVEESFTADPRPIDYANVKCNPLEKLIFSKIMYGAQDPMGASAAPPTRPRLESLTDNDTLCVLNGRCGII